jgi:hypothetical protein
MMMKVRTGSDLRKISGELKEARYYSKNSKKSTKAFWKKVSSRARRVLDKVVIEQELAVM